jgi:ATP-dependent DNA ligase
VPAHIRKAADALPDGTYDGEETIPNGVSSDVKALKNAGLQQFIVFDMMQSLGNSIVNEPYDRRRAALERIAKAGGFDTEHIQLAPQFAPSKAALQKIWKAGGEGVILKRRTSRYLPGRRATDWIKIKRVFPELVTVTGYEAGENGPYSKVVWVSKGGIVGTCKTKNNFWLRELAANPEKYLGEKLWITHYGLTAKKFRGPLIWDRWENE